MIQVNKLASNIKKIYAFKFLRDFWIIVPIIIPFYKSNNLSVTQIFLVQAIFSATMLFFEIPSGYFADILGRKKTLIIGALLLPISLTIYALSHSFWPMALAEFILGIGFSMCSGTESALIFDTLKNTKQVDQYQKLEGKAEYYTRLGAAIASVFGGLLALSYLRLPFYVNIFSSSLMCIIALTMIEPKRAKLSTSNPFKEIIRIVRYSLTHKEILPVMTFSAIILATGITSIWGYFLYLNELNINLFTYGVFFAIFQLSSAYGAKYSHWFVGKIGIPKAVYLLFLIPLIFFIFGIQQHIYLIWLPLISAWIWGMSTPLFLDVVNNIIDSEIRATVLSVSSMGGRLFYVLFSPLFGLIVDRSNLSLAFIVLSLIYTIIAGLSFVGMKNQKMI